MTFDTVNVSKPTRLRCEGWGTDKLNERERVCDQFVLLPTTLYTGDDSPLGLFGNLFRLHRPNHPSISSFFTSTEHDEFDISNIGREYLI